MGALEASRDMETGKVASRAAPVPGPTVEQRARAVMAEQGTRAAMADPGTPWAMEGSHHPKNVLGRSQSGRHSGSADTWGAGLKSNMTLFL